MHRMTEPKLYTRAELVELTGVNEDALIFWLRKNLLESEVTDSRKHKRFRLAELRFVRLLMCLRKFGINVRHMADVLNLLRLFERMGDELPTSLMLADVLSAIEQGQSASQFDEALHRSEIDGSDREEVMRTFSLISEEISQEKGTVEAWRNYLAYAERVPIGISVSDSGIAWTQFVNSDEQFDLEAMLVLNLKHIFAGLEQ